MDADVLLRTGEASRLRRRGALYGRRPTPPSYLTLTCGAAMGGWRFKFLASEQESTRDPFLIAHRTPTQLRLQQEQAAKLPIEWPTTGCNAPLTEQGYTSSSSRVYKAASGTVRGVLLVEALYLDEEQKGLVEGLICESFGAYKWSPLACKECGNIVGFRYAPHGASYSRSGNPTSSSAADYPFSDTNDPNPREGYAFFPSDVTASNPLIFPPQKTPQLQSRHTSRSHPHSQSHPGLLPTHRPRGSDTSASDFFASPPPDVEPELVNHDTPTSRQVPYFVPEDSPRSRSRLDMSPPPGHYRVYPSIFEGHFEYHPVPLRGEVPSSSSRYEEPEQWPRVENVNAEEDVVGGWGPSPLERRRARSGAPPWSSGGLGGGLGLGLGLGPISVPAPAPVHAHAHAPAPDPRPRLSPDGVQAERLDDVVVIPIPVPALLPSSSRSSSAPVSVESQAPSSSPNTNTNTGAHTGTAAEAVAGLSVVPTATTAVSYPPPHSPTPSEALWLSPVEYTPHLQPQPQPQPLSPPPPPPPPSRLTHTHTQDAEEPGAMTMTRTAAAATPPVVSFPAAGAGVGRAPVADGNVDGAGGGTRARAARRHLGHTDDRDYDDGDGEGLTWAQFLHDAHVRGLRRTAASASANANGSSTTGSAATSTERDPVPATSASRHSNSSSNASSPNVEPGTVSGVHRHSVHTEIHARSHERADASDGGVHTQPGSSSSSSSSSSRRHSLARSPSPNATLTWTVTSAPTSTLTSPLASTSTLTHTSEPPSPPSLSVEPSRAPLSPGARTRRASVSPLLPVHLPLPPSPSPPHVHNGDIDVRGGRIGGRVGGVDGDGDAGDRSQREDFLRAMHESWNMFPALYETRHRRSGGGWGDGEMVVGGGGGGDELHVGDVSAISDWGGVGDEANGAAEELAYRESFDYTEWTGEGERAGQGWPWPDSQTDGAVTWASVGTETEATARPARQGWRDWHPDSVETETWTTARPGRRGWQDWHAAGENENTERALSGGMDARTPRRTSVSTSESLQPQSHTHPPPLTINPNPTSTSPSSTRAHAYLDARTTHANTVIARTRRVRLAAQQQREREREGERQQTSLLPQPRQGPYSPPTAQLQSLHNYRHSSTAIQLAWAQLHNLRFDPRIDEQRGMTGPVPAPAPVQVRADVDGNANANAESETEVHDEVVVHGVGATASVSDEDALAEVVNVLLGGRAFSDVGRSGAEVVAVADSAPVAVPETEVRIPLN
ncbi:hypothetical protein BU17DRAFT_63581 [Hysterangium stoloniferum]|nr:hypothetical protein BU17DRAFT_63581 [Hysterangium stoloniferum]